MGPDEDSYSVFQAQDEKGVGFQNLLNLFNIAEIYIGGLATDYCVKSSVLDALKKGFKVWLLVDAIRGVNLRKDDSLKAIKAMLKAGAKIKNLT